MTTYEVYRDDSDDDALYIEAPFRDALLPQQLVDGVLDGEPVQVQVVNVGSRVSDGSGVIGYIWGVRVVDTLDAILDRSTLFGRAA